MYCTFVQYSKNSSVIWHIQLQNGGMRLLVWPSGLMHCKLERERLRKDNKLDFIYSSDSREPQSAGAGVCQEGGSSELPCRALVSDAGAGGRWYSK